MTIEKLENPSGPALTEFDQMSETTPVGDGSKSGALERAGSGDDFDNTA